MHEGKKLVNVGDKDIVDCKHCRFAHTNPLPTQVELIKFYKENFYQDVKTSYFEEYERDKEWWMLNYNWLLDDLESYKAVDINKKTLRLLDIGSGPGLFLRAATDRGMYAMGIEPSLEAYKYSKEKYNCNVVNVMLNDLDHSVEKFDIVNSALVLEHVLDPTGFINTARSFLKKNGLICITVPNDFNPVQDINFKLGTKQWWVSPFEHLNYFNANSLKKLIKSSGFEIINESVSFPIDLFLLMGKNYLETPMVGLECHKMRKTFEFNINKSKSNKFRKDLYKAFSKIGVGRELIIIAKKI
jgi:SAM-dependent methyltransferase